MATSSKKPAGKKSNKPTMRELATAGNKPKKRQLKAKTSVLAKPLKRVKLPGKTRRLFRLPNNRFGRFLDKTLMALPRYLKNSWYEIRQTTWPGRKETVRLTFAVFVFSTVFAAFVSVLDYGLDKLFKHLIIK